MYRKRVLIMSRIADCTSLTLWKYIPTDSIRVMIWTKIGTYTYMTRKRMNITIKDNKYTYELTIWNMWVPKTWYKIKKIMLSYTYSDVWK